MNESKQVALLPEPENLNPIQLLQIAVSKGVDAEQLKLLMELQREWKAEQARDAFVTAMNAFRAEALKVVKTKEVAYKDTRYKHATLADTVAVVAPALSKHGLSHRWETKQDGAAITVSCIITHELGHSAQTSLTAGADTTGSKNSIQAIGSAVSYLQRYTFMAITGLAAQDADDDGQVAELITDQQAADLEALAEEVGADKARFLKFIKAPSFTDIPARAYATCVKQLEAKRRA